MFNSSFVHFVFAVLRPVKGDEALMNMKQIHQNIRNSSHHSRSQLPDSLQPLKGRQRVFLCIGGKSFIGVNFTCKGHKQGLGVTCELIMGGVRGYHQARTLT